jgi:hypothetical protein
MPRLNAGRAKRCYSSIARQRYNALGRLTGDTSWWDAVTCLRRPKGILKESFTTRHAVTVRPVATGRVSGYPLGGS